MTTIDHLRPDCRVRVLQDFTDLRGRSFPAGETGVIRLISVDYNRKEIRVDWERKGGELADSLYFSLTAREGPGNGRMRQYFEVEEEVPLTQVAQEEPSMAEVREEVPEVPVPKVKSRWWEEALELEAAGQLKEAEQKILKGVDNLWGASMVAEMYARRMRRFQEAGDQAAALEAFRKVDGWIFYFASLATSGGEGAALSLERDEFRAELVRQFGYDPELEETKSEKGGD